MTERCESSRLTSCEGPLKYLPVRPTINLDDRPLVPTKPLMALVMGDQQRADDAYALKLEVTQAGGIRCTLCRSWKKP